MHDPADLAVVIPTRERWPILEQTLTGLARQSVTGFETIVVVDGTDQPQEAMARARTLSLAPPPRVVVVPQRGPGGARNAGVAATDRPLVLFLGDDMVPGEDLVARHVAHHARHPEQEVAVLGRVVWHSQVDGDRLAGWLDWSGTQFDFPPSETEDAGFGRFYSCNVSLKRALFTDAGGFDEDFVYYYEDLDCSWRLARRGMRLVYEPAALARHLHQYDWPRLERRFEGVAAGERMMAAKHDWFAPFFAGRIREATSRRPVSGLWPWIVELVPHRMARLRRLAQRRANRWYYRRLAPAFERGWATAPNDR